MTKRNDKTGLTVADLASFFEERCKYLYIKLAAFLAPTSIIVIDCSLLRPLFFSSLPRSSLQCSLCDSCFNHVYTVSHNIVTSTTIAQCFFSILISLGIATAPNKHASRNSTYFFGAFQFHVLYLHFHCLAAVTINWKRIIHLFLVVFLVLNSRGAEVPECTLT